MSTGTTQATTHETMSLRAAAARAGVTTYRLLKLAAAGEVRTVALPGIATRFLRGDVEKLAASKGVAEAK